MCSLTAQQVRIPFPLGEHYHHQGSANANRLAGRETGGICSLPVRARGTADLNLQVDVFTIIQ